MVRPHAARLGSYVNALSGYEEERVRAAYGPAKYERSASIKAVDDPANTFHRNTNITPG